MMRAETDPHGRDPHTPGAKLDGGKVRVDLIFDDMALALLEVAKVATYGAQKYTEGGWLHVPNGHQRYTAAMDRHRLAEAIEPYDLDSHLLHAAHLAWNALARLQLIVREMKKINKPDPDCYEQIIAMTTTDTLSISETLTILRASNKQLTKELRKAKDKLERKDLLIVELQKRFKDYSEYEKWVNHKENYKQELENKIRTRQEELQELKELGLTNLDILQRETRLKNAESELSAIEARIKSRNAVLFKVEPKANRLRELESSIDMIAKNLAKQGAHLYDTLEQITSLYDSLLPPNPTSAEATD